MFKGFKALAALIIALSIGVTITASTGITVKTLTDKLFGATGYSVSYSELPFNESDDIITAGSKSAKFIVDQAEQAEKTIEDVMNEYKDTVKEAMRIAGGN